MAKPLRSTCTSELIYSDEERDFLIAVQCYKEANRRPWPTWREILALIHSLGYRKVAAPEPPPTFRQIGAPTP